MINIEKWHIPIFAGIFLLLSIPGVGAWYSDYTYRVEINATCDACSANVSVPLFVNHTIGGFEQEAWCNITKNESTATVGYLYYTDLTSFVCTDPDDVPVDMFVEYGNTTSTTGLPWNESAYQVFPLHDLNDWSTYQRYNLTANNTPVEVSGRFGNAYEFAGGSSQFLQSTEAVPGYTEGTVILRVYTTANGYWIGQGFGGGGWGDISFYFGHDGTNVELAKGPNGNGAHCKGGNHTNNEWKQWAFTWSDQNNLIRIFVNDTKCMETAWADASITANHPLLIGRRYNGGYVSGKIDHVEFYNYSMSDDEIFARFYQMVLGDEESSGTAPEYTNASVSPPSPQTYADTLEMMFNSTWVSQENIVLYVEVEHNLTGSDTAVNSTNTSMSHWNYTLNDSIAAGYYQYRFCGYDNNSLSNCTDYYYYTIDEAASGLTLSASPAWSAGEDTTVTVTCSANSPLDVTLTVDGVNVTNPYSATFAFDNYIFNCTISDTHNYTPTSTANTLSITSGGFGCTDNETFAYELNVSVDTSVSNQSVFRFTSLVADHILLPDLGDVFPITNNEPAGWYNTSGSDYYFIANVTGHTNITVRFGNAYADHGWTLGSNTTTATTYTYSQINPYMRLTFVDERTGAVQLPPGSNRTLSIYCTDGTSLINISDEYMFVATTDQPDEIRAQVQYSVTEIYGRNYAVGTSSETRNVYLVDANEDQVVELVISLQDATGDFNEALLKAKKYIDGNLRTITEHYFDAEDKVIIYLINGDKYAIYIDNDAEERSIGDLYVDSVDLTKTLSIGEVLIQNRTLGNLTWSLTNTTDTIEFSYIDESGLTSSAEMSVYYESNDTLLYYTSSTNRSSVVFTYTVPNVSIAYKVNIKIHHYTFGLNTIDLWYVYFGDVITVPYPFFFPLAGTIPGITWENLVGTLLVIGSAMSFTAVAGAVGGIFGVVVAIILVTFGWFEGATVLLGIALILSVINKLNKDRRVNIR